MSMLRVRGGAFGSLRKGDDTVMPRRVRGAAS